MEKCTVCQHPEKKEIEQLWWSGEKTWSVRNLAYKYGLSAGALQRHMFRHVFVQFDNGEIISRERYFKDIFEGKSFLDPDRADLINNYKKWLNDQHNL